VLERFLWEVTRENRFVLRYLVQRSGLLEHPVACFLKAFLANRLGSKPDLLTAQEEAALLKPSPIHDPVIFGSANTLLSKMKPLVETVLNQLTPCLRDQQDKNTLHQHLANELVAEMQSAGYCSIFYHGFPQEDFLIRFKSKYARHLL
jgi:hypothetical protein